jgi:hypothetical protein
MIYHGIKGSQAQDTRHKHLISHIYALREYSFLSVVGLPKSVLY